MSIRSVLLLCLAFWLLPGSVQAFPPAPYYTIFGNIRDESGQLLDAEGARVILLRNNQIVLQAPVTGGVVMDQNYELRIPIDMLRPNTVLYRDSAVVARSASHTLAVQVPAYLHQHEKTSQEKKR